MSKILAASMLVATSVAAWSQTRLDLRTQTKNVDFSSSLTTRPVKVGTAIPAACASGEMFFKADASAGANLFGCTSTNTWTAMSSTSGGASLFGPYYCADAGTVNAYACNGVAQMTSLSIGQLVLLRPATGNTSSATLNVNGLGAKAIRKSGSQALVAGELAAGQVVSVVYDGTAFQVQALGIAGPQGPAGATGAAIGGLLTAKGDTAAHNGSAAVRLGVCPDGQAHLADSTQAAGWRCGTAGGGAGVGLCAPASASGSAYACAVPGVAAYAADLTLLLRPDVASAGPATINVNGLGAKALMRSSANGIIAGELAAGSSYLIGYDGVTFRMHGESIEPDGSGSVSLRRDGLPHTLGVTAGVFGALNGANAWMGNNDFSDGFFVPPQRAVAALPPAAAQDRKVFVVTDGAGATDCTTGGGSAVVLCRSNGAVYAALNGGGGGAGGPSKAVQAYPASLLNFSASGSAISTVLYGVTVGQLSVGAGHVGTWWMAIPTSWSGVAPVFRIFWNNAPSDSTRTYNWAIRTSCDVTGGLTYNAAQTLVTNDTSAAFVPQTMTLGALGLTGCPAGSELRVQVAEGAAGFTSSANHYLKGLEIVWPLN